MSWGIKRSNRRVKSTRRQNVGASWQLRVVADHGGEACARGLARLINGWEDGPSASPCLWLRRGIAGCGERSDRDAASWCDRLGNQLVRPYLSIWSSAVELRLGTFPFHAGNGPGVADLPSLTRSVTTLLCTSLLGTGSCRMGQLGKRMNTTRFTKWNAKSSCTRCVPLFSCQTSDDLMAAAPRP